MGRSKALSEPKLSLWPKVTTWGKFQSHRKDDTLNLSPNLSPSTPQLSPGKPFWSPGHRGLCPT